MRSSKAEAHAARWNLAVYGVAGAAAPDILLLFSKRWSMPGVTFHPWQYASVSLLYFSLSALVASIFPYRGAATPWKAFAVGVGLPVIISGAASLASGYPVAPRGGTIEGTLLDLIAFF